MSIQALCCKSIRKRLYHLSACNTSEAVSRPFVDYNTQRYMESEEECSHCQQTSEGSIHRHIMLLYAYGSILAVTLYTCTYIYMYMN